MSLAMQAAEIRLFGRMKEVAHYEQARLGRTNQFNARCHSRSTESGRQCALREERQRR